MINNIINILKIATGLKRGYIVDDLILLSEAKYFFNKQYSYEYLCKSQGIALKGIIKSTMDFILEENQLYHTRITDLERNKVLKLRDDFIHGYIISLIKTGELILYGVNSDNTLQRVNNTESINSDDNTIYNKVIEYGKNGILYKELSVSSSEFEKLILDS